MCAAVFGPYSPVVRAGDFLYVSGQLGHIDPETGRKNEDIVTQTRQCLQKVQGILKSEGASMDDVVKSTVFLKNAVDFPKMNEEYARHFPGKKPARSTIIVNLLSPEMLIEIECVAYRPQS